MAHFLTYSSHSDLPEQRKITIFAPDKRTARTASTRKMNRNTPYEIEIHEATEATEQLVADIGALLRQLSSKPRQFTLTTLQTMMSEPDTHLYVATAGGHAVGMLTIAFYTSPTGRKAWVEDVVVDSRCRGHGICRKLVTHAIDAARGHDTCTLMLTSRPSRLAANALYRSAGFEQKETNVYKKEISQED